MWVLDLYDSAGAESPCDSLSQGHLGLDSQKTRCRLSKQSPLFAFLWGNRLLHFVPRFWKSQPWEEELRKHFPSFQSRDDDRTGHKFLGASGLLRRGAPRGAAGQPPAPFADAPWRKGLMRCRSTHLVCTVPLWAPFLSCWEHAPLRLLRLSIS